MVASVPRHVDEAYEQLARVGPDVDEALSQDALPIALVGARLPHRPAGARGTSAKQLVQDFVRKRRADSVRNGTLHFESSNKIGRPRGRPDSDGGSTLKGGASGGAANRDLM